VCPANYGAFDESVASGGSSAQNTAAGASGAPIASETAGFNAASSRANSEEISEGKQFSISNAADDAGALVSAVAISMPLLGAESIAYAAGAISQAAGSVTGDKGLNQTGKNIISTADSFNVALASNPVGVTTGALALAGGNPGPLLKTMGKAINSTAPVGSSAASSSPPASPKLPKGSIPAARTLLANLQKQLNTATPFLNPGSASWNAFYGLMAGLLGLSNAPPYFASPISPKSFASPPTDAFSAWSGAYGADVSAVPFANSTLNVAIGQLQAAINGADATQAVSAPLSKTQAASKVATATKGAKKSAGVVKKAGVTSQAAPGGFFSTTPGKVVGAGGVALGLWWIFL
jgi:hypothetical protein